MLVKDHSTNGHSCIYTPRLVRIDTFVCTHVQSLKHIRITRLLTDSNPSSHRGGDNDRRQELRHFVHQTFLSQLKIIRSMCRRCSRVGSI